MIPGGFAVSVRTEPEEMFISDGLFEKLDKLSDKAFSPKEV